VAGSSTRIDGIRYVVRQHAVSVIHDAGECNDETFCTCMAESSSEFLARSTRC